jgi:hypothetical protein
MGNRGGQLHDGARQMTGRQWASRQWISCGLQYKDRRQPLMEPGHYTQLFFLDEVTALAAGHRPCALCRRAAFLAFMGLWARTPHPNPPPQGGRGSSARGADPSPSPQAKSPPPLTGRARVGGVLRPLVAEVDGVLHAERLDGSQRKRTFAARLGDLPEGTMIRTGDGPCLCMGGKQLPWSPAGYGVAKAFPANTTVDVLTPPSIVAILAAGYAPLLHPSAG